VLGRFGGYDTHDPFVDDTEIGLYEVRSPLFSPVVPLARTLLTRVLPLPVPRADSPALSLARCATATLSTRARSRSSAGAGASRGPRTSPRCAPFSLSLASLARSPTDADVLRSQLDENGNPLPSSRRKSNKIVIGPDGKPSASSLSFSRLTLEQGTDSPPLALAVHVPDTDKTTEGGLPPNAGSPFPPKKVREKGVFSKELEDDFAMLRREVASSASPPSLFLSKHF